MKRPLLLSALLALCILLTGCNRTTAATAEPPAATGFSCGFAGTYRGEEVAGSLQRSAAGLLTATLTAPESLSGLTMTWNGETVALSMLGLDWEMNPDAVPQAALGRRVLNALDAVVYGEGVGDLTDDGRLKTVGAAGEDADGGFTLYSDPATGDLLSLEVPSEELTLTFSEFTRI